MDSKLFRLFGQLLEGYYVIALIKALYFSNYYWVTVRDVLLIQDTAEDRLKWRIPEKSASCLLQVI